jgi:hypothetical protein
MRRPAVKPAADPEPGGPRRRWLLLVQQLPTQPSSVRIKTWRRLQQIGSVVLKNSVYVLPHTPQAREDFEWLAGEIRSANGQASILVAEALTGEQESDILQAFRAARTEDYGHIQAAIERLSHQHRGELSAADKKSLQRACKAFDDDLARVQAIDYFGSPARAGAEEALEKLKTRLATRTAPVEQLATAPRANKALYQRRMWVTRPRPGIDRMSCAWLIRRFIDPRARFVFAERDDASRLAKGQVPFDMFGAEFGHHGGACSFETLCHRFGITDQAVRQIAEIVHDVDLKEQRYARPQTTTIAGLVEGLRATYDDDGQLLDHGMALFAGLYESLAQTPSPPVSQRRRRAPKRR